MGQPILKLLQEVETRWNSTFLMLQRILNQREAVGASLAGLNTDITNLSSEEFTVVSECLEMLSPFNDATVELSEEKSFWLESYPADEDDRYYAS